MFVDSNLDKRPFPILEVSFGHGAVGYPRDFLHFIEGQSAHGGLCYADGGCVRGDHQRFSIILFGGLWGVAGMIVAVPLFAVLYDLTKRFVGVGLRKNGCADLMASYNKDYHGDPKQETK